MTTPLVLLSNDDGIDSPYLEALAESLTGDLRAEVLVIAPERQRSAMSHTITLHKPLRVREVAANRFSVSGTPVDCVYIGLMRMCPRPPSLVVSGINDGFNLGTDVFYSGTVGAAVEGGLRGVPSLAVSMVPGGAEIETAVSLARDLAGAMIDCGEPGVLNLNIPSQSRGLRWTRLGKRFYDDDVHERRDPRGRSYFWIGGGVAGLGDLEGSDCKAIGDGYASVTPLKLDPTDTGALGRARSLWPVAVSSDEP